MPSPAPPDHGDESRNLARGGALSFLGAATSALLGFVTTFTITRSVGTEGAGIALQAISVFMIVLSIAKLGMDSVAIWLLPRLRIAGSADVRPAMTQIAAVAIAGGTAAGVVLVLGGRILGAGFDSDTGDVAAAVAAVGWFVPFGALALVALAATRGLGDIRAFVLIGSFALPGVRLAAIVAVAVSGGSAIALSVAWASAFPIAAVLAGATVIVLVRRGRSDRTDHLMDDARTLKRAISRYAVPRTVSAALEQSILYLDVLLVGLIAGASSAGIYGGASRLIAAGLIVDTAIRAVVSSRFSALLFENRISDVQALYRTASVWLVLFSAPIYIVLAIFAPVILSWLGPGFEQGATAMAILCVGAVVTFLAGNIHSVLLMSGRSGLAAVNKAIALAANVAGNVILVPLLGIEGAAISWAASMLIDALLASIQVRRTVGIAIDIRAVSYSLFVPLMTVGGSALMIGYAVGRTAESLVISLIVGGTVFVLWCIVDRRRLQLNELIAAFRAKT